MLSTIELSGVTLGIFHPLKGNVEDSDLVAFIGYYEGYPIGFTWGNYYGYLEYDKVYDTCTGYVYHDKDLNFYHSFVVEGAPTLETFLGVLKLSVELYNERDIPLYTGVSVGDTGISFGALWGMNPYMTRFTDQERLAYYFYDGNTLGFDSPNFWGAITSNISLEKDTVVIYPYSSSGISLTLTIFWDSYEDTDDTTVFEFLADIVSEFYKGWEKYSVIA